MAIVKVKLDGGGVKVQLESVKALLLGGIAFETDPDLKSSPSKADQAFPLYANRDAAHAAPTGAVYSAVVVRPQSRHYRFAPVFRAWAGAGYSILPNSR